MLLRECVSIKCFFRSTSSVTQAHLLKKGDPEIGEEVAISAVSEVCERATSENVGGHSVHSTLDQRP